jgi:hypothetical protein
MMARALAQKVMISHTHTHTLFQWKNYDEEEEEITTERIIENKR